MNRAKTFMGTAIVGISALGLLSACGGVSELTKERVARSETAVQQAQQSLGNSEAGAVELQRAKSKLDEARSALGRKDSKQAERAAAQAELSAQLAMAKSQTAQARKAADDLLASIQTLRQEAARGVETPR